MKKLFIILFLVLFITLFIYVFYLILFSNKEDSQLWGFINKKGEIVIKPKYYKVRSFSNSMAVVKKYGEGYGYINKEGKEIVTPNNLKTRTFSEGIGIIEKKENNKLIINLIDSTGKTLLSFNKYKTIHSFNEGLAAVATEKYLNKTHINNSINTSYPTTYGYINKKGKEVIKPNKNFYYAHPFHDSVAVIASANKNMMYYLINHKGEIISEFFSQRHVSSNNNRIIISDKNKKIGYINTKGETVIPPKFSYGSNFSEGLAAVGNKYFAFIDTTGTQITNTFSYIDDFSEGLAAVEQNNLWGFINKEGKMIIEPQFIKASRFHEGLAAVIPNNTDESKRQFKKWGFINKTGKLIIPAIYKDVKGFSEGMAAIKIE